MKNKVVIITGASSGIGKACAQVFGSQGAQIVITGRNPQKLEAVNKELTEQGITVLPIIADVSIKEDNLRMVEECLARFGKIDILINNAGISMRALFEKLDIEVIDKVMDINFRGMVYATKAVLPHIIASKGSIVGVSSIAGYRGLPARTGYSASKFAMQGFLEALRTELLHKGVHVLIACPGFTASNIRKVALTDDGSAQGDTPRKEHKMMSAEEVANHILKAVQKRKPLLTLTFKGKLTIFLNKWLPRRIIDRLVYNNLAKEDDSPFGNS